MEPKTKPVTAAEWLALFDQLDRLGGEYPEGFNRQAAERRFLSLAQTFADQLGPGCSWETGILIQDAGFHGWIVLPQALWAADGDPTAIRVSNFGNLADLSCHGDPAPAIAEALARPLLEQAGYWLVPCGISGAAYTGALGRACGRAPDSWWRRFFDFL